MTKLWLTYAWKDNEAEDVDFIASRLAEQGIDVRVDRTQLLAGRRLWEQIDEHLRATDLDGWAIYITENSLKSEPCQEELAYALDRTLRTKGAKFPLIGIFPTPVDSELVPSALATRLWVHLKDVEWSSRVKDALVGSNTQTIKAVAPFEIKWHEIDGDYVCEMRPREGQWYPAFALVPETDFHRFKFAFKGPRGSAGLQPAMFLHAVVNQHDGKGTNWQGWRVDDQIDSTNALYARFNSKPSKILFGGPDRNYIQP